MLTPPPLDHEASRLDATRRLNLLDSPLEERFERITRIAKRLLRVEIVAISLVDRDKQFFKSIHGLAVCETDRDVSFCGHAIHGMDVMVVPDARKDPRFADNPLVLGPPHIAAYAGAPIRSGDHAVGTICAIDSSPRAFTSDDVANLFDLARIAETELRCAASNAANASLLEQLDDAERRARVDPLTRVWNRDGVMDLLTETLRLRDDDRDHVAVLVIDLDDLKPINDQHGHAAGDEALRESARRMLTGLRGDDTLGRIGGDEFVAVITKCTGSYDVESIAQRLRDALTSLPVLVEGQPVRLSASVGGAVLPPGQTADADALIAAADDAMYHAKRHAAGITIDTIQPD
jgi:diguanylate cyclase (GGDEF)-like protein